MDTVIAPRDERKQPVRIVPGYPQTRWLMHLEPRGENAAPFFDD
jgi:hypothetical protein